MGLWKVYAYAFCRLEANGRTILLRGHSKYIDTYMECNRHMLKVLRGLPVRLLRWVIADLERGPRGKSPHRDPLAHRYFAQGSNPRLCVRYPALLAANHFFHFKTNCWVFYGLDPHSFTPWFFSKTDRCFPMCFCGFLERSGSLERMELEATLIEV